MSTSTEPLDKHLKLVAKVRDAVTDTLDKWIHEQVQAGESPFAIAAVVTVGLTQSLTDLIATQEEINQCIASGDFRLKTLPSGKVTGPHPVADKVKKVIVEETKALFDRKP